jgi:hypothetical protein
VTGERRPIGARLREELRDYAITALYLYVCLGALLLLEAGVRREQGVSSLHFGLALGKALILGKFMLIGEAARIGTRRQSRTLLQLIVRKVVLFLVLLVALSVAEEFLVGWFDAHSAAETLAEYARRSPLELFATVLLVGLVLVPYVAAREVGRALGPGGLRRLLLARPD